MPKILSESQIAFYQEQGYLNALQIIPPDLLELMQIVLERWVDETIQSWLDAGLIDDPRTELDFQHRLVEVWRAADKPKYMRSPRRDLVSPEMFQILTHPALLDLAQDILQTPEIAVHGVFNARPKLPDQAWTRTPWHQDAQYYRDAEKVHVTSIWMPLQPVSEENSCLQVAAGLHRGLLYEGHTDTETGFLGLSREDRAQLEGISMEMEPGDALCFTQVTPHRALANRSNAVRWSMDMRYEPIAQATETGRKQGFIARSESDPASVIGYDEWLTQWESIPAGNY